MSPRVSRPAIVWRAPPRRGFAWWAGAAALFALTVLAVFVAASWATDAGWM